MYVLKEELKWLKLFNWVFWIIDCGLLLRKVMFKGFISMVLLNWLLFILLLIKIIFKGDIIIDDFVVFIVVY